MLLSFLGKTNRFPENHIELCKNRLSILDRKLSKEENLLHDYNQLIVDQLKDGIIENCDISDNFSHLHYVPNHCVVKTVISRYMEAKFPNICDSFNVDEYISRFDHPRICRNIDKYCA